MAGQAKIGEFLRIRHPPHPIVQFYQLIGGHDLASTRVLLRREVVLDDFKNRLVAGQHEHGHDHALDPRGEDEGVVGVLKMGEEVAIELRFSMAIEANGGVELVEGLARE